MIMVIENVNLKLVKKDSGEIHYLNAQNVILVMTNVKHVKALKTTVQYAKYHIAKLLNQMENQLVLIKPHTDVQLVNPNKLMEIVSIVLLNVLMELGLILLLVHVNLAKKDVSVVPLDLRFVLFVHPHIAQSIIHVCYQLTINVLLEHLN